MSSNVFGFNELKVKLKQRRVGWRDRRLTVPDIFDVLDLRVHFQEVVVRMVLEYDELFDELVRLFQLFVFAFYVLLLNVRIKSKRIELVWEIK